MALRVLIVGAGIGGPALAMLLQRSNPSLHKITIVEQHPTLRTSGQQIDVKGEGVRILRKMGLLDAIKAHHTNESGLEVVDSQGKPVAFFGVSPSGEKRPGLTAEHEIMRHDFVKILHDASLKQDMLLTGKKKLDDQRQLDYSQLDHSQLDQAQNETQDRGGAGLTYEFGKTIASLDQSRQDNLVHVTFSDGQTRPYDLVVGADGQGSRTRKLAFGSATSRAAFKSTGVHGAYFSIPRIATDPRYARAYSAVGRRMVITRTGDNSATQVLLYTMGSSASDVQRLSASYRESVEAQKDAFAASFQGSGWQMDRFLDDMRSSNDFFAHEVCQIKMDRWHAGRVVLLGDSAYCPSPFTGMGATGCLAGAYVLAGELARHGGDVPLALEGYGKVLRPAVDEYQDLPVSMLGLFFPSSQVGGFILRSTLKLASKLQQLTRRGREGDGNVSADGEEVAQDKTAETGWVLPEYPELNL